MNAAGDTAVQTAVKHGSLLTAAMLINSLSDQVFLHIQSMLPHAQVAVSVCIWRRRVVVK